jgi:hypothetical protein
MLNHDPFYFSTIRKAVMTFGTLFNEIRIQRPVSQSNSSVAQTLLIPIRYAPKEKALARLNGDPNLDRPGAMPYLPMMSFEIAGFEYDTSRKIPKIERIIRKDTGEPNNLKYTYTPVPYNIDFELNIIVKYPEDGLKIVEQILPFFTPDFTPNVSLIPELSIDMDTPVILRNTRMTDLYEGDFIQRRAVIWTLTFTLKTYLFGPVRSKPIIKMANTTFYFGNTTDPTEPIGRVVVTPGLLPNGSPTTNSALSVNTSLIEVDDDFGFCVDFSNTGSLAFQ